MLQRLAVGTAFDEALERRDIRRPDLGTDDDLGLHTTPGQAEHMADEELRHAYFGV